MRSGQVFDGRHGCVIFVGRLDADAVQVRLVRLRTCDQANIEDCERDRGFRLRGMHDIRWRSLHKDLLALGTSWCDASREEVERSGQARVLLMGKRRRGCANIN